VIGIETDRGLWAEALVAAGYQVYAINPMAASRYRDRHTVSGAKSDAGDAKVLADLVRTDRHNHRPVAGDSPEAAGIKVLARAHQSLIWERGRHTNRLRNALREYYPAALEAFANLADRDTLAVLAKAPTPDAGARLTISQFRAALKRGGRQRGIDTRAAQIQTALRTSQLTAPAAVVDAFAATTRAAVAIISELNRQITDLETELATHLSNTRTPTSTSPNQDSVMCSAPGCSASSGTTPNATPTPSLAGTTPAPHPSPSPPARNEPS
jgi:transposase